MSVTITGASDDLIEIDGEIREEFNHLDDEPGVLAFSDGTLLRIVYDKDGIWRITLIAGGSAQFIKIEGVVSEDMNDVVTLHGDIKWVAFGKDYAVKGKA